MIKAKLNIKPIPVPSIYQPVYKLILLLAILKYGTRKPHNCTFLKLHLYLWAMRTEKNFISLKKLKDKSVDSILPWTYEPGLNKLLTIALVNNYCSKEIKSNELQITLTEIGSSLIDSIEDKHLFKEDIDKIKEIGIISQTKIKRASTNWSLNI